MSGARELVGERLREVDQAGIRHAGGHRLALGLAPAAADDVHDASPARTLHVRDDFAAAAHHPEELELQALAPFFLGLLHGQHLAADLLRRPGERVLSARGDRHPAAFCGERQRRRLADAHAAARDQRALSLQAEIHAFDTSTPL
jgi:hypothetical protein